MWPSRSPTARPTCPGRRGCGVRRGRLPRWRRCRRCGGRLNESATPARGRRNLLITIDGAGSSHKVIGHLSALNDRTGWSVRYSVGFDLDERVRTAIGRFPQTGWQDALAADGTARDDAAVAELTGLL